MRLYLGAYLRPYDITFSVYPSWQWKPLKWGAWDDPDYDSMTAGSVSWVWLCFSVKAEKRLFWKLAKD